MRSQSMVRVLFLLLLSVVFMAVGPNCSPAAKAEGAGTGNESLVLRCREELRKTFPRFRVERVLPSPISGVCEVWAGTNVFYFEPEGRYLIFGEIWTSSGKSLTAESRARFMAEKIKRVNLSPAIRWGEGKKRVILIVDPDCPFCKRLEKEIFSEKNRRRVRVHLFLYPLAIHKNAREHSIAVLCSKDPVKTLVSGQYETVAVTPECRGRAEERLEAMRKALEPLGVRGTPVTIVGNRIFYGAKIRNIQKAIDTPSS